MNIRKTTFTIVIINMFILGILTSSIYAEYLGGKWENKDEIWYKVEELIRDDYESEILSAATNWNVLSSYDVDDEDYLIKIFKDNSLETYDVLVKKSPSDEQDWLAPSGCYALGIPTLDRNGGPYDELHTESYEYGEIRIVTRVSDDLSSEDKKRMLTHEFGHILGLAHTEKWFTESIMDESDVFDLDGPTDYDNEQLINLYN